MKAIPMTGDDLKESDSFTWEIVGPPKENPDNLPYPTHQGVVVIAGHSLRVYQLNTGQRIFNAEDVEKVFAAITQPITED